MQQTETTPPGSHGAPEEKKFVPKGAMAFFILLIFLTMLFWYGIYLLMIQRA